MSAKKGPERKHKKKPKTRPKAGSVRARIKDRISGMKKKFSRPAKQGTSPATRQGTPPETTQRTPPPAASQRIPSPVTRQNRQALAKKKPEPFRPQKGVLYTGVDRLVHAVKSTGSNTLPEVAAVLGWKEEEVERVALVLERAGILDVHYPALPTQPPVLRFVQEPQIRSHPQSKGEILASYKIDVDFVPVKVEIIKKVKGARPFYQLEVASVGPSTRAFLDEVKDEIAEEIPVEVSDITDVKKSRLLKERFFNVAQKKLEKFFSREEKGGIETLSGLLLHMMYGLGDVELFMGDDNLEEVAINSAKTTVAVYHREFGWLRTNVDLESEDMIVNFSSQIARKVSREINNLAPILDAHLVTGDRVNATLSPISTMGNTITIRRFSRRPWTLVDFVGTQHTMTSDMAAMLWMALQYEMSILIAGGTASGKTSVLNGMCAFMPSYHRIISIEDVREINLPEYMRWNWVPLTTRNPNPEGLGEVTMLDLLQSSLRMRPDRIILGEMRRRREAEVLFEAMHTGHSVYSTIHADSASQVLRRLIEPPMSIPPLEVEAVDLVTVQYRDRKTNRRRTYEIAEVEAGVSSSQLSVNIIYKYSPREDTWDMLNKPVKLFGQLNMHTGMTESEILQDMEDRKSILEWLVKHQASDFDDVGKIMRAYYSDAKAVKKAAKKDMNPADLVGE